MSEHKHEGSSTAVVAVQTRRFERFHSRSFIIPFVIIVLVVFAGIFLIIREYRNSTNKAKAHPAVSASDVSNANKAVDNNQPISQLNTYGEAYAAADTYAALGKYQMAYTAYQKALSYTSTPGARLYISLAQTAQQLGKTTDAKQYYQDAVHAYDFKQVFNTTTQQQIQEESQ